MQHAAAGSVPIFLVELAAQMLRKLMGSLLSPWAWSLMKR